MYIYIVCVCVKNSTLSEQILILIDESQKELISIPPIFMIENPTY